MDYDKEFCNRYSGIIDKFIKECVERAAMIQQNKEMNLLRREGWLDSDDFAGGLGNLLKRKTDG